MSTKTKNIIGWVLQSLLALEFIIAGQAKFTQPQIWEKQFTNWGYPDNFYLVIGLLEVVGAIFILIPRFTIKATLGLIIIMLGATVTHMLHQQWSGVLVTVIITAVLGGVYLIRREKKVQVTA